MTKQELSKFTLTLWRTVEPRTPPHKSRDRFTPVPESTALNQINYVSDAFGFLPSDDLLNNTLMLSIEMLPPQRLIQDKSTFGGDPFGRIPYNRTLESFKAAGSGF